MTSATATRPHGNRHGRAWNHDLILDAVARWTTATGAPPAANDWNPARGRINARAALAKARAWHDRIELFEAGGYPSLDTVAKEFGSFSACLAAAGHEPRPVGRTPRELTERQIASLRRREVPGTPSQLAVSFKAVVGAQAAHDQEALASALYDLAAAAMAWCERIATANRQETA